MHYRYVTFFLLILSSICLGTPKEEIRTFLDSLQKEQKLLLEGFFKNLVQDSFSGYVLFGDKPMCIEAHSLELASGAVSGMNDKTPFFIKGFAFWEACKISSFDKDYCFLIFDVPQYGSRHLVCIHRKQFIRVVNENLVLFRYVLGPTVTAEGLLQALINGKETFYQILKNDNALLGILLGYGTQNALLISRKEAITEAFGSDQKEEFPFLPKAVRKNQPLFSQMSGNTPSLGFHSLGEEVAEIKKLTTPSRSLKPFDTYRIPCFGCQPHSLESQELLTMYEKNRKDIMKAIASEDFLEQVLLKLLVNSFNQVELPKLLPIESSMDTATIVKQLASIIHQEMTEEKHFKECFKQAFLQGMRDRAQELPFSETQIGQRKWAIYLAEKDLEYVENWKKTFEFFQKVGQMDTLRCLVPDKLYFQILHEGLGLPMTLDVQNITLQYSFHLMDEKKITAGTVTNASMESFLPGVAYALIGMKRGESRKLYIHPEYGYGTESYFPPNMPIIAQIELVDFEKGEHPAVLASPCTIEKKDFQEIVTKYDKLQKEQFYSNGVNFWNFIRGYVDFPTFEKAFQNSSGELSFSDTRGRYELLAEIEWKIKISNAEEQRR